jgi:hypothetical protein
MHMQVHPGDEHVPEFQGSRSPGGGNSQTVSVAAHSRIVPSDSDPDRPRSHFRFDRIVCRNVANNPGGETSPLVAEQPTVSDLAVSRRSS